MSTLTLFIHGIGSANDTWDNFLSVTKADEEINEIQEFKPNITKINKNDNYYFLYEYKSKIITAPLFTKTIQFIKESYSGKKTAGNISIDNHVDSLKSFLEINSNLFTKVNIISHSMGGVITMKLLCNIIIEENSQLKEKIKKILLLASPLSGSNEPEKLSKILGKKISTNILNELKPSSTTLSALTKSIELNQDELKKAFDILYISANEDNRIIDVDKKYLTKFCSFQTVQGGHSDIITPQDLSSISFIIIKNFLFEDKKKSKNNDETFFTSYLKNVKQKANELSTIVFPLRKLSTKEIYEPLELSENISNHEYLIKEETFKRPENNPKNDTFIDYNTFSKSYFIVDKAGMGKSTFCKNLILKIFENSERIPIFLELSQYNKEFPLVENLCILFDTINNKFPRLEFKSLVEKGKFFIILDGFDELTKELQIKLQDEIRVLNEKKGNSSLLITSRPQEISPHLINSKKYHLKTLTKEQAKSILLKYDNYSNLDIGERLIKEFHKIPEKFLETPLLVGLLYRTYGFNNSIADKISIFYSEIYDALYKGHDLTKSGFTREKVSGLDIDNFREMLRIFSFLYILKSDSNQNSYNTLLNLVKESESFCSIKPKSPRAFLEDLEYAVPLITKDGKTYKFMHRTIAEFFAAEYIIHSDNSSDLIKKINTSTNYQSFLKVFEFIYEISPNLYLNNITRPIAENYVRSYNEGFSPIYNQLLFESTSKISYWKISNLPKREDGTFDVPYPDENRLRTGNYLYGELNEEKYVVTILNDNEKNIYPGNAFSTLASKYIPQYKDINFMRTEDLEINDFIEHLEEGVWYNAESEEIQKIHGLKSLEEVFLRRLDFLFYDRKSDDNLLDIDKCKNLIHESNNLLAASKQINSFFNT